MSMKRGNMVLIFDFDIVSENQLVSIGDFGSLFLGCTRKPKSLQKSYFSSSSLAKKSKNVFLLCSDRRASNSSPIKHFNRRTN
jgi:hypothetical protein